MARWDHEDLKNPRFKENTVGIWDEDKDLSQIAPGKCDLSEPVSTPTFDERPFDPYISELEAMNKLLGGRVEELEKQNKTLRKVIDHLMPETEEK